MNKLMYIAIGFVLILGACESGTHAPSQGDNGAMAMVTEMVDQPPPTEEPTAEETPEPDEHEIWYITYTIGTDVRMKRVDASEQGIEIKNGVIEISYDDDTQEMIGGTFYIKTKNEYVAD